MAIRYFFSVAAVAAEIQKIPGIGPAVAARIAAALELGRRMARETAAERPRIQGPADVYELCALAQNGVLRVEQEHAELLLAQIPFGPATLLTLGPILMQLGHLLLADLLWISFVILVASVFWREPSAYVSETV